MEFETREDGKVDIIMPRFRHNLWKRALQPHWRREVIPIHLDEIGSAIWLLIDGTRNVNELCDHLQAGHHEKLHPHEETERRVTKFLSLLYQQRYITFKEITLEKKPDRDK